MRTHKPPRTALAHMTPKRTAFINMTTGVVLAASGPNARMILNGVSQRQTAVSHSTPAAEIIAADYATRAEGTPASSLLSTIFECEVHLRTMEDNEVVI
jgi:hypothetical protein